MLHCRPYFIMKNNLTERNNTAMRNTKSNIILNPFRSTSVLDIWKVSIIGLSVLCYVNLDFSCVQLLGLGS